MSVVAKVTTSVNGVFELAPGIAEREPRLLTFGLAALLPMPRKPAKVLPLKVELVKNSLPFNEAVAPGTQPKPKQPEVEPWKVTSSALAVLWAAANIARAVRPRTSCLVVIGTS